MYRMIAAIVVVATAVFFKPVFSENIYIWTDADGVRRFSDVPPPSEIQEFTTTNEIQSDPDEINQAQDEYDRLMQQVNQESEQRAREESERKAREVEVQKSQEMAKQAVRVFAERERLEKEMNAIDQRGLSSTFGPGQKAALMEAVQKKMDLLNNDPDAYFRD